MKHHPVADTTAREFLGTIADPDVFSGGGSVAAVTGAGAASTALLVLRLNAKRKRNAGSLPVIERGISQLTELVDRLFRAADDDIATLQQLLDAQRSSKTTGKLDEYSAVLQKAAAGPISIAESIGEVLDVVVPQMEITTRFTVSDLGAAAVLAEGAARAALLTAEVNIALLRDLADPPNEAIQGLESRLRTIRRAIMDSSERIERTTRATIHGYALSGEPMAEDLAP